MKWTRLKGVFGVASHYIVPYMSKEQTKYLYLKHNHESKLSLRYSKEEDRRLNFKFFFILNIEIIVLLKL